MHPKYPLRIFTLFTRAAKILEKTLFGRGILCAFVDVSCQIDEGI
jgi:hypothetical protein